jgi:ribosome-associated protein
MRRKVGEGEIRWRTFADGCGCEFYAIEIWVSHSPTLPLSPSGSRGVKIGPRFASGRLTEVEVIIAEVSSTIEARQERSKQLALAAARTAEDNRGGDVAVLDMRDMTTEFDYFVLATGNSRRQLHAISEEIDRVLERELGDKRMGIEGYNESRWILLDYGTVVIHMFDAETRAYYALEDLWGDAKRVPLPWRKEEDGEKGRRGEGEGGNT